MVHIGGSSGIAVFSGFLAYTLTKLLILLYIVQLPKVWYNVWYEG